MRTMVPMLIEYETSLYIHSLTLYCITCRVGEVLAKRALEKGIDGVEWKRNKGQRYHGKIAALLTKMNDSGLKIM